MSNLATITANLAQLIERAKQLEPSAPDQEAEDRYWAAMQQVDAARREVDRLRAAQGLPPLAEFLQPVREAEREAAHATLAEEARVQAEREAEKARTQSEREAAEFARAMEATDAQYGRVYDQRGIRVALVSSTRRASGRSSALGYEAGGQVIGETARLITDDGRDVSGERVVLARTSTDVVLSQGYAGYRGNWQPVSLIAADKLPPVEGWLPVVPARRRMDVDVAAAWRDAEAARAEDEARAEAERLAACAQARKERAEARALAAEDAANPFAILGGLK